MKIVIAPDSFKECMSSQQVAAVLSEAVHERWPEAEVVEMPLADGGEGTLEILTQALHAEEGSARVHDPLGRPMTARYAIAGDTAIVESARVVGLSLVAPSERDILRASTIGLGELLLDAYEKGCRHFIMTLGGTATCDGGAGMLSVPGIERLKGSRFELLCDVDAPFVGPTGAARVFAPQKGATPADVEVLEERMLLQASRLLASTGIDVSSLPGAGAAGGLGGACMAYFGAERHRGIDRVLDLVHFSEAIRGASLILTGEGKSDAQTLMGKVPMGVLQRADGCRVALLSGRIEDRAVLEQAGFDPVVEVSPRMLPPREALCPATAARNLRQAVFRTE